MTDDDGVWSAFSRDPRDPAVSSLRASDADRDVVHRMLADAYADGRIDRAELEARTAQTQSARVLGELLSPIQDLIAASRVPAPSTPVDTERRAVEAWRKERREAFWGLVSVSAIVWTIWLVTSGPGSFPWPAFVTLAALLNLGNLQVNRGSVVAKHRRRLERKARKQLGEGSSEPEEGQQ